MTPSGSADLMTEQGRPLGLSRNSDAGHIRTREVRACDVGAGQVRSLQAGTPQARAPEARVLQLAAAKRGIVRLYAVHVLIREPEAV